MNSVVGNYSIKPNYQQPAFKGYIARRSVPCKDPLEHFKSPHYRKFELTERTIERIAKWLRPLEINVAPEKTFEQLGARLKKDYYASKISHFFDIHGHIRNLMMKLPKECERLIPEYNPKEAINSGYEFVMKNKDNLGTLSLYSQNKNADFIKGMLKALKELGLVK